tara:strand:- start:190 stop:651 length:462 start_codon:yes stop_codon:yes gene_type:complete
MNIAEITVSGNVGQAPEIKEVNGTKVANFSIAVNENYRDKSGEQQKKTHWYNVEAWDGKPKDGKASGVVSRIIEPHLGVGSTVYVRGFPQIDSYQDKDGVDKKAFKIKIAGMSSQIRLAGSKPQDGANDTTQGKPKSNTNKGGAADLDDEIPF